MPPCVRLWNGLPPTETASCCQGYRRQEATGDSANSVYDDRDVDITSMRFFQTSLVASFHHCLRVVKPAADDAGVLKNVLESGHRRFFEIRHGTGRRKLCDQRRYFLEDFDIQGLRFASCHVFHSRVFHSRVSTPVFPLPRFALLRFSAPPWSTRATQCFGPKLSSGREDRDPAAPY